MNPTLRRAAVLSVLLLAGCAEEAPPCEIGEALRRDAFERMRAFYSGMSILKAEDYSRMTCAYQQWNSSPFWSWYRLGCKVEFDEMYRPGERKSVMGAFDLNRCKITSENFIQSVW